MLVSATIRGTLPAAAELPDGTLDIGLGHPEPPRPPGAVALEATPPALLNVAAEGLAEELAPGATFLFGDPLGLTNEVRGKGEGEDSCGTHRLANEGHAVR